MTSVLWFRRDLRLHDQPALARAAEDGPVVPLFVLDPVLLGDLDGERMPRVDRLLASLRALSEDVGGLVIRTGDPAVVVPEVAAEVGASVVHISRETTPYGRRRDERVVARLRDDGRDLVPTGSPYAVSPGRLETGQGGPYKVFTPFSRAWRDHGWPGPAATPEVLWENEIRSDPLPEPADEKWAEGAGEAAALARWAAFLDEDLEQYDEGRDRPDRGHTSRMSAHLKYGEIHPRTMLTDLAAHPSGRSDAAQRFMLELAWREFYADVLWHRPDSAWGDLRAVGVTYDDESDPGVAEGISAWKAGRTGYPFVDAGMRELAETGFMHNRLRMITASFLTKDLHVWWPVGARHFLDHLLDGDLASNNHGWQWAAGTGTDAAPYFRVFNPVTQGQRFDPSGDYVRRWVPELAHLPGKAIHEPWKHEDGYAHGYAERIVDHAQERAEALRRYERR